MPPDFNSIFSELRQILQRHSGNLLVNDKTPESYSLAAEIGPATLQAWRGKAKHPTIPIAWVQIKKTYVSFHLMGLYSNHALQKAMSTELKARMQGKTCFNFKVADEQLFHELEELTVKSIDGFRRAGYIVNASVRKSKAKKEVR